MPSVVHEALVEIFRSRPSLAAELLHATSGTPPSEDVESTIIEADLSQVTPPEYRADTAVRLRGALDLALAIEVQLRREPEKLRKWPAYGGILHARHGCPAAVLVVAIDRATASWASAPISFGPGAVLRPLVIGPEQVPRVSDAAEAAANPEIALLSALTHGAEDRAAEIGIAAVEAAGALDDDRARLYVDLILQALSASARAHVEAFMIQDWQPQSDFLRRLYAEAEARGVSEGERKGMIEGERKGKIALLLAMLRRRFGPLSPELEQRVLHAPEASIQRWAEELPFADSAEALLAR